MTKHSLRHIFAIKRIPTIPTVSHEIAKQTRNFQFDEEVITGLVRFDPGLVCNFLARANAQFDGMREVSSIKSSVQFCGHANSLEILEARFNIENDEKLCHFQEMFEFAWGNCISQAIAAESLGEFEFSDGTETMFLTGLISDLGVIALMQTYPEEYHERVWIPLVNNHSIGDLQKLERKAFGFSHVTVGHELGRRWHLGESISSAILQHHQQVTGGFFPMIAQAAALAIEVLDSKCPDNQTRASLDRHMQTWFQIDRQQVDQYLEKVAMRRQLVGDQLVLPIPTMNPV